MTSWSRDGQALRVGLHSCVAGTRATKPVARHVRAPSAARFRLTGTPETRICARVPKRARLGFTASPGCYSRTCTGRRHQPCRFASHARRPDSPGRSTRPCVVGTPTHRERVGRGSLSPELRRSHPAPRVHSDGGTHLPRLTGAPVCSFAMEFSTGPSARTCWSLAATGETWRSFLLGAQVCQGTVSEPRSFRRSDGVKWFRRGASFLTRRVKRKRTPLADRAERGDAREQRSRSPETACRAGEGCRPMVQRCKRATWSIG